MELIRRSYAVFYVILLCALAKGGSEGKRWKPEEFDRNWVGLSSSLQTEGKVKQVWSRCRKELVERNNAGEHFDMRRLERSSDMRSVLLLNENIHKATELLPPRIKENLWNCVRKRSLSIPITENKEDFGEWLTKHFGSPFESSSGRRRDLVTELPDNQMAPSPAAPAQSPGPAIATPTHGPTPASSTHGPSPASSTHGPSPASSTNGPSPASSTHGSSPSSSTHGPSPADDFSLWPKTYSPFRPPPSPKRYRPIPNASPPPEQGHSGEHSVEKTLFIVAVVAASAAFLTLIALLLCWPRKKSDKVDPKVERKDESPLLTLSLSDFSAGSEKFVVLGNSDKKESDINNGKVPSAASHLSKRSEDPNTSVAENTSSEDIGQVSVQPPARSAPAPPGPPQPPPAPASCPPPPPKPRVAQPPPAPPKPLAAKTKQPSPLGLKKQSGSSEGGESDARKPKLKPFFWDKVNAKPDRAMVWHDINAGSFQFNEEKIESLFGTANQNSNERRKDSPSLEPTVQYIQIIDPKKAQNLSILLRALNVTTEEIIDALEEGNEFPVELIQTLLKMAPTTDEELKLRLFTGDLSELGPAERFLKVLVNIPYAFKRLESLMFMISIPEDISSIKESFATLEVACNELRESRLFLKLLEAVLKTGNRMNDGTYRGGAQAFRLDTLLKLSDVKGTDGKTTLLHFVVQEIIRSEGVRAVRTAMASRSLSSVNTDDFEKDSPEESEERYCSLGIQAVSGLGDELEAVKKAAIVDGDWLTAAVSKVGRSLQKTKDFLNTDLKNLDEDSEFRGSLVSFVEKTEAEATWLLEEEKRIMSLVKSTADYFHGTAGKDEGLRLFVIVSDFLIILDKVCKEVKDTTTAETTKPKVPKKDSPSSSSPSDTF